MHAVAPPLGIGPKHHQRVVDQLGQHFGAWLPRRADRLGGFQSPPAGKHRQSAQDRAFLGAQEVVGPVDQRVQRPLARHDLGRPPILPGKALMEPLRDRVDGQRAGLRGGDFDRQRNAVELLADPGDR